MNGAPYIPAKTAERMASSYPPGTRHAAMFQIAIPLIGNGMAREAVFAQLRGMFDAEKSDKEIWDVIDWSRDKNPQPSGNGNGHTRFEMPQRPMNGHATNAPAAPVPVPTPEKVLGGEITGEADWFERSPIAPPEKLADHASAMFSELYAPLERVNLVRQHFIAQDGKPKPHGPGKTLTQAQWLEWFQKEGPPFSEIGCWLRPNPCKETGTGKKGAVTDADIVSFRFVFIESDSLPLETQLSLYAKLPLPIAAIVSSGNASAHAWLKIDAKTSEEYETSVKRIYGMIEKLGFDPANKNPSRLSRLPGVRRELGGTGTKEQRLMYLNPNPKPLDWDALEHALHPPEGLIMGNELNDRITEYFRPKPEAFTLNFLRGNGHDGFFFRDGEVTLWSGLTGDGKSSMLATVMVQLAADKIPFFICSMESLPEALCATLSHIAYGQNPTESEVKKFLKYFGGQFCFADFTNVAPDQLMKLMAAAQKKFGARHFIIDPFMRITGLEGEYPAQNAFVTRLQVFAKANQSHIHLVAHPKKHDAELRTRLQDVKGSNDLTNNVDNVVIVRRNVKKKRAQQEGSLSQEEIAGMHDVEFYVEKQRATGELPMINLRYDKHTKLYELFVPPKKEPKANQHTKYYKQNE